MRRLPSRTASSAWPTALLILCAPVWFRSSRFSQMRAPRLLAQPLGEVEGRRPADVVAAEPLEVGGEGRVGAGGLVPGGELVERAHHGLGDEPAAEVAEPAAGVGHRASCGASFAFRTNARMRSWSFTPGAVSTPRAVSTPQGRAARTASATFSGSRLPARMTGWRTVGRPRPVGAELVALGPRAERQVEQNRHAVRHVVRRRRRGWRRSRRETASRVTGLIQTGRSVSPAGVGSDPTRHGTVPVCRRSAPDRTRPDAPFRPRAATPRPCGRAPGRGPRARGRGRARGSAACPRRG